MPLQRDYYHSDNYGGIDPGILMFLGAIAIIIVIVVVIRKNYIKFNEFLEKGNDERQERWMGNYQKKIKEREHRRLHGTIWQRIYENAKPYWVIIAMLLVGLMSTCK